MNTDTYDVVVVGGGAIGLCSAYYLSRSGASVVVVDKGKFGHGSSLHNAGYISPSHFVPLASPGLFKQGLKWMLNPTSPLYIKPRFEPAFLAWVWRFARACDEQTARRAMPVLRDLLLESRRLFEELAAERGMNFGLMKRGLTILYNSDKGQRACEHEARLAEEMRVEARLLDRKGLETADPKLEFRARGGIHFPVDMHLVPALLVQSLETDVQKQGVRLIPNCAVESFNFSNGSISGIVTKDGTIQGKEFVLAGGAWSPGLLKLVGIKMHLQAGKGYSITTKNPAVKPNIPYILQERRVAITPFADALRFAGTMELAGISHGINRPRVQAILSAVPHYFGNMTVPTIDNGELWDGLRPVTPDGVPYLGRFRKIPNLIAATGHAMIGISLAAVTGALVRDIVRGNKPAIDLSLLDPNRYN